MIMQKTTKNMLSPQNASVIFGLTYKLACNLRFYRAKKRGSTLLKARWIKSEAKSFFKRGNV